MKLFDPEKSPLQQMSESLSQYSDPFSIYEEEQPKFYFGKEKYLQEDVQGQALPPQSQEEPLPPAPTPEQETGLEGPVEPHQEEPSIESEEADLHAAEQELLSVDWDEEHIKALHDLFSSVEEIMGNKLAHHEEVPIEPTSPEAVPGTPEEQSSSSEAPIHVEEPQHEIYHETNLVDLAISLLEDFGGNVAPASGTVNGVELVSKYQDPITKEVFVKATDGRIFCVTMDMNGHFSTVKRTSFNPSFPQAQVEADKSAIDALNSAI